MTVVTEDFPCKLVKISMALFPLLVPTHLALCSPLLPGWIVYCACELGGGIRRQVDGLAQGCHHSFSTYAVSSSLHSSPLTLV